jgi:MraZ protein
MDEKGRTSVPSRYRDVLSAQGEARLVLTTGLEPCLVAYPLGEWMAFEEKLSRMPQFDASVKMLRRIYVSGAVECDLDKHGRILVPATLRKHAGLDKDALWAGMGRHAEMWAKERFDALREEALADEAQRHTMAERLAELGL